jgi:anti-sigma regulatory factor (Ser/Thr protein kinase)
MQEHARRFPGRPEHIRAARQFVAAALAAWPATQQAALLLVSEVVTNAVLHSASGDHGGSLEVRYALDDHEVYVEVVDAGGAARPQAVCPVPGGGQRSRVDAGGGPGEWLGSAQSPRRPRGLVPPALTHAPSSDRSAATQVVSGLADRGTILSSDTTGDPTERHPTDISTFLLIFIG